MLNGKGIISKLQSRILVTFSNLHDASSFYLTGGTALAEFYLGHRRSYDLDIFTAEQGLILPFSRIVEEEFKKQFSVKVIRRFSSFVEFEIRLINEITKVQFAFDSPFRFEKPVDSTLRIKVNSYTDIIVDKLLAFYGRAEPRDGIDLFFILEKENLWDLTHLAHEKDPGFDLYWLAVAFEKIKGYPDEITRWPVDMIKDVNVMELKSTFSGFAMEIMNKMRK